MIVYDDMGMGQNLVPLVNVKIAGKWMFIPLKMVLIGIDPYPYMSDLQISKCQAHALHQIPLEALGPSAPETFMEPWEDRGKPALLR